MIPADRLAGNKMNKGEIDFMKGKWKARVMAAVMAFCMGISPAATSAAYAAEEQPTGAEIAIEAQSEAADTADFAETRPQATAEDITKDISDLKFDAETSLEGITFKMISKIFSIRLPSIFSIFLPAFLKTFIIRPTGRFSLQD